MADAIVIRSDLPLQEILHICFILFRYLLCKNLRIFLKTPQEQNHTMKRFAVAVALMCALSTSTFAGLMPTDGKSEPPPPPATSSIAGEMPAGGESEPTSSTVLVSVILTILNLG
jgi:hypothetical protein